MTSSTHVHGVHPPGFGEPAPRIAAPTDGIARYAIDVAAGRWMVVMAFGTLSLPACAAAHAAVMDARSAFDDENAVFFGLSIDPDDKLARGLENAPVGVRYLWDFDQTIIRNLGLIKDEAYFKPWVFLIDPGFRIAMSAPIEETEAVLGALAAALAQPSAPQDEVAPVLILPRVLEPSFCQTLIDYFNAHEAQESGFSADVDGKTVTVVNSFLKRRQDVTVHDEGLRQALEDRIRARIAPAAQAAFAFEATEIERYLICRYAEDDRGFFSAHRDNVTIGTAHRKFAVSMNLNAEDYEGGDLRFPEFGRRLYRPPTGGAAVFSCGLLHEATPVTRGVRYTVVPFLYDQAGARIREANLANVDVAGPPRTGP